MLRRHRIDATLAVLAVLATATILTPLLVPRVLTADAVLLALAALKGRKIALDYLDLRTAPAMWRGLVSAWVFLIAAFAFATSAVAFLT